MTYTQLSRPWKMAHPTEYQVVYEITIARQVQKEMPLFTTVLVVFFVSKVLILSSSHLDFFWKRFLVLA